MDLDRVTGKVIKVHCHFHGTSLIWLFYMQIGIINVSNKESWKDVMWSVVIFR